MTERWRVWRDQRKDFANQIRILKANGLNPLILPAGR